jgi:hypothetical protein
MIDDPNVERVPFAFAAMYFDQDGEFRRISIHPTAEAAHTALQEDMAVALPPLEDFSDEFWPFPHQVYFLNDEDPQRVMIAGRPVT